MTKCEYYNNCSRIEARDETRQLIIDSSPETFSGDLPDLEKEFCNTENYKNCDTYKFLKSLEGKNV